MWRTTTRLLSAPGCHHRSGSARKSGVTGHPLLGRFRFKHVHVKRRSASVAYSIPLLLFQLTSIHCLLPALPPPSAMTSPMTLDATSSPPYTIVSHPVLLHKLTQLRNVNTPSADFRRLVKEISGILGVEASRNLQLKDVAGVSFLSLASLPFLSDLQCHAQASEPYEIVLITFTNPLPLVQLHSPIAPFVGQEIAHRIGISPILRAGIGMTDC